MIKQIIHSQPSDMLRIEYMPGNVCNHKCHYCFPGSNEGNLLWPDVELVKTNLSHLLRHYESQGKTKSNLFIVGGEPTLWKGLEDLCKYLKDNHDIIIEMSTNGTRKLNWWEENAQNFDHVTVSVHREFANVDHLINVCDLLYEKDVVVGADVLMDPDAFDVCTKIVDKLQNSKYNWPIISKVVHFNGTHRYTEEQLEYVKDKRKRFPGEEWYYKRTKKLQTKITIIKDDDTEVYTTDDSWLIRNQLNYFTGWECNLGLDIIKILPGGRITGNCGQSINGDHYLYEDNFIERFKPTLGPVICSMPVCKCNEETVCAKRKLSV